MREWLQAQRRAVLRALVMFWCVFLAAHLFGCAGADWRELAGYRFCGHPPAVLYHNAELVGCEDRGRGRQTCYYAADNEALYVVQDNKRCQWRATGFVQIDSDKQSAAVEL